MTTLLRVPSYQSSMPLYLHEHDHLPNLQVDHVGEHVDQPQASLQRPNLSSSIESKW